MKQKLLLLLLLLVAVFSAKGQDISLYQQFNGRYDFTFVGNTLNPSENNPTPTCTIFTSSSESLALNQGDVVQAAYLYWAGSGTGDLDIKLNGVAVTSQRTFPLSAVNTDLLARDYFSAFADVTELVRATGNGVYTVSDLDLRDVVSQNLYCGIKTNFGGWAIIVFYTNNNLPINQLNLYDGMQYVPDAINISLPSLNVVDNIGAKIGFLAWEGDSSLAVSETLTLNGVELSNDLNPPGNAFNSTNSITGSTELYNMDLDVYEIQNFISIGDQSADISLSSGQDFVMVNAIVTKLNSQLPDATVSLAPIDIVCDSRVIEVEYTIANVNSTLALPAQTPVAIYINGNLYTVIRTIAVIPIGGSERGTISITVPAGIPMPFELLFVADDKGDGSGGIVTETDETNNSFMVNVSLKTSPVLRDPEDMQACNPGSGFATFNFSEYSTSLKNVPTDSVTFYTNAQDAAQGISFITNPGDYTPTENPQEIYVRLENEDRCYAIKSFTLITDNCPDATITAVNLGQKCDSREVTINYTVYNTNAMGILPAGTSIAIYADGELIELIETLQDIGIGGSESGTIPLTIPNDIPQNFTLLFVVDDIGNGTGLVTEMDENNNTFSIAITLLVSPAIRQPATVVACNQSLGIATFDFSHYEQELKNNPDDEVTFYITYQNAESKTDPIFNTSAFVNTTNPQIIYVRMDNGICHSISEFMLLAKKCPPVTYNYITPNGDGINDTFFVTGLRNIFLNFKINIYNRWGNLVWTGDHSKADWDGIATEEKVGNHGTTVPAGTYYFVLELNDPDYPEPIVGWVYVTM